MSQDPFAHLRGGQKIPRSARAWRELVETAHEVQRKRSGLPSDPASSTDFFPNLTVEIRNFSGTDMVPGELIKVLPPEAMGVVPAGAKLLNAKAVFPALKPDLTTSSFARVLELIRPNLVGKAAVLGWVGSGAMQVGSVSRRVPSQRCYAGTSVVGVPYLNTVYIDLYSYPMLSWSYPGVPLPFEGIPWGFGSSFSPYNPPTFLPGMESIKVGALSGQAPNRLVRFSSRFPQQFRGTFTLLFRVTRTRGPLKDMPTGRTIGYGYPGLTVNTVVDATRQGQSEPLSGVVSSTLNPLWVSRHPRTFTVNQFDSNFAETTAPLTYYSYLSQVIPFSTFSPSTFNDPTKWNYQWQLKCSFGGPNMPPYAKGEFKVDLLNCVMEFMETQRDDTATFDGTVTQPQPQSTPSSIAGGGGGANAGGLAGTLDGPISAGSPPVASGGFSQSAFSRIGGGSMTADGSTVTSSGNSVV